jgi:hypothetical protein
MFHPRLAAACRNRISIDISLRCGVFHTVTAGNTGGDIQCN